MESVKNVNPYIHAFKSVDKYYIYDVNTNRILNVSYDVFSYLSQVEKGEIKYRENISSKLTDKLAALENEGYLKSSRVLKTEHPLTPILKDYLCHKLKHMTLQITQSCNLRCEYCVYSGGYNNRIHSQKKMDICTAQKAIYYLVNNSDETDIISIGFYGGEPLLNFDMIRQCVGYAEKVGEGRKIMYTITTNGTLLNKEIIDFFVSYDFGIVFSLDGPEKYHDMHRKFATTSEGSFKVEIENIKKIMDLYPEYYKKAVSFNMVMDPANSFDDIDDFIAKNPMFSENRVTATTINSQDSYNDIYYANQFKQEYAYAVFVYFLQKLGRIKNVNESKIIQTYYEHMKLIRNQLKDELRTKVPDISHHSGPCIPGVTRLFVNAEGILFPCEKVSETSEFCCLGDIQHGIDARKSEQILNVEKLNPTVCHNCWAYNYCGVCAATVEAKNLQDHKIGQDICLRAKNNIENVFRDILFLEDQGYDFDCDMLTVR